MSFDLMPCPKCGNDNYITAHVNESEKRDTFTVTVGCDHCEVYVAHLVSIDPDCVEALPNGFMYDASVFLGITLDVAECVKEWNELSEKVMSDERKSDGRPA